MKNAMKNRGKKLNRLQYILRLSIIRVRRALRFTKLWANRHRVLAGSLALFMLFTALSPVFYGMWQQSKYNLSSETEKLLGHADADLAKKLVYDTDKQAYVFNKEHMPYDIPGSSTDQKAADQVAAIRMLESQKTPEQTAKVGGAAKDEQLYSSQFTKEFKGGATYYDNEAKLSFSLLPKFTAMEGDRVGDRLVYPLKKLPGQAIYTVKEDGVKEDVVLQKSAGNTIRLEYTLALPKNLEAKLLDSGHIGIYSADPSIYSGAVQGTNVDLEASIKAQEQAPKTHLAFVVPAPVITESDGKVGDIRAEFDLKGEDLSVVASGLDDASYPLSIDPTVVVANSSSLASGNNESNSILSSSDVKRQATTGGDFSSWTVSTSFADGRRYAGYATYNGYMYIVGGFNNAGGQLDDVEYAPLNSNGTVGTWTSTTSLPDERMGGYAVAYDGYIYLLGGSYATGS